MSAKVSKNVSRRDKVKKKPSFAAVGVVVIIVLTVCTFGAKLFPKHKAPQEETDFIFNGYVYPEEPARETDILLSIQKDNGVKTAYLTFDDGPNSSVTPRVLDVLRKYNIKATFFMVGSLMEKYPDMARRVYEEGHFLANHSYSHEYNEVYANEKEFMLQIDKTEKLIYKITDDYAYPKVFRFPGGGYDSGSYAGVKQLCKKELEKNGYRYCDWNALTGDAEIKSPTVNDYIKRLKSSSSGKEDIVVLMHDSVTKKFTAESLSKVIEYLMSEGYVFDTLEKI